MIYKIIATLEHKETKLTQDFKNKIITKEEALKQVKIIHEELDRTRELINELYYKFEETYHVRQALNYAKDKGLNKWLVIKYFDSRYKKLFKESKFFTKQYLRMKRDVMWLWKSIIIIFVI